jgi:hypothetical protein
MTEFVPTEKGQTVRYPSTANLCVDSQDRVDVFTSPFDFNIYKQQNIISGFFTRIGVTEFVINWNEPNVQTGVNDVFSIQIGSTNTPVTLPQGFYTVADLLDEIVVKLNTTSTGTWSISSTNGLIFLENSASQFTVNPGALAYQLFNIDSFGVDASGQQILNPDIRIYKYIDIVSNNLTYNQDLKDASTGNRDTTSLCRVYLTYPAYSAIDAYGFPVKFGYKPDTLYRNFTFPKQIKWDNIMPIGSLAFQVFGSRLDLTNGEPNEAAVIPYNAGFARTEWQMTLQISEV